MTNKTIKTLAVFTTILATAAQVFAGRLSLNLGELPKEGAIVNATYDGVNLKFIPGATMAGAYIWRDYGDYSLTITSTSKPIVKIEFEGARSKTSGKTADLVVNPVGSKFEFYEYGTSTWEGSATSVRIAGASVNTGYTISTIRIWREGDGDDDIEVDVLNRPGPEVHYYAQARTLPTDGKPVTLAVVAHSKFREALKEYLVWKTQQGYHVEDFYSDEIAEETKTESDALALAIREKLVALNPQPSYVLLVGDEGEVPYFTPRTAMAGGHDAVTDFFYGEYSGDHFPEAAVGRFSATTVEELRPQMEKTKYMAFIKPSEAGWLKRSFIAHAPAYDIKTEKSSKFGKEFSERFPGNTAEIAYPTSTSQRIEDGCSYVAYIGHGWMDYWEGYYLSSVRQLRNENRYPVVLGLTCLSGSFQHYSDCMAEAFMRRPKGGAVAYIGATRESWDGADNLFFMGGNNAQDSFEHIGFMRSLFHPDEEDTSQITRTIGDAFNVGKFACRFLGEYQPFRQFMEFFTLFGDPTYQPYITVPRQMFIRSLDSVAAGRRLALETAPDAVVCISKGRDIIAIGLANNKGKLTLKIPKETAVGTYTIYSSAPFYNDFKSIISITASDGEDPQVLAEGTLPAVNHKDVIDVKSAANALPGKTSQEYLGYQPQSFNVGSSAKYTMWAGHNLTAGSNKTQYQHWLTEPNDTVRGIFLRNQYDRSGFITTASAGNVAYVEVDWLHSCGQAEILGVYGSKSPYKETAQAWNGGEGEKLGEIRKGSNDRLLIKGDWPYILIRAEDYEGFYSKPSSDLDAVFVKSITIGWINGSVKDWGYTESESDDDDYNVVGEYLLGVEESENADEESNDPETPGGSESQAEGFVESDFYLPEASSDEWILTVDNAFGTEFWDETWFSRASGERCLGENLPSNAKVRIEVTATKAYSSWPGYRRLKFDSSRSVASITVISVDGGNQTLGLTNGGGTVSTPLLNVQGVEVEIDASLKPTGVWIGYEGCLKTAAVYLEKCKTISGVGTLNLTAADTESIRETVDLKNFKGRVIGAEKIEPVVEPTPDKIPGREKSIEPGATLTVTADDEQAAITRVKVKLTDTAAEEAGQVAVLKIAATRGETDGTWILSIEIAPEQMEEGHKIDDTVAALGKALSTLSLQSKTRAGTTSIEIPAESVTSGLYYSVCYSASPDFKTCSECQRSLAKPGENLELELPADSASTRFFKVKASMTQNEN